MSDGCHTSVFGSTHRAVLLAPTEDALLPAFGKTHLAVALGREAILAITSRAQPRS
jgi:hypothetical protein